jgi:hypothetical protein
LGLLTDGLLLAATLFAGTYCWVLARRVDALKDLDRGLGGAIVQLTRQIELARATLDEARASTRDGRQDLAQLSARAETAAGHLRLLLAAVNDPNGAEPSEPSRRPTPAKRAPAPAPARSDPAPLGRARPTRPKPGDPDHGEEEILATLRALAGGGEG